MCDVIRLNSERKAACGLKIRGICAHSKARSGQSEVSHQVDLCVIAIRVGAYYPVLADWRSKMFKFCEVFMATPKGKNHPMCDRLVSASGFFSVFMERSQIYPFLF